MKKIILSSLVTSSLLFANTSIDAEVNVASEESIGTFDTTNNIDIISEQVVLQETVPGFKQPIIQGLMGDQVFLTIDGVPFTNSLFRSGPNQYYSWIPDEFVNKATLNDPLASISGNALGGSLDRVLGISGEITGKQPYISSFATGFNTGNNGIDTNVVYKDRDYQIGMIFKEYDNVNTPSGEVENSAYNQKGILFKHNSDLYGDTSFMFTRSDDIDRTDKFEKGSYYVYDLQQYLHLNHKYIVPNTNVAITPSFQQFKESIDKNDINKNSESLNNVFGIQAIGFEEVSKGFIEYGLTASLERIESTTGLNTNDYNYDTYGIYAAYNDSIDRFDYKIKSKYSLADISGSGLDRTIDNFSYGIDTRYNHGLDHSSFFMADLSYKFPTITNLAEAKDDSVTEIANPDLEQEKAYTITLGHEYNGWKGSVFYKKLYDMIIREQTTIPDGLGDFKWQYQNANEGHLQGINLSYSQKYVSGLGVYFFAEYLEGENDYDYFSKLTPFHTSIKLTQDLSYFGKDLLWGEFKYAPKVDEDLISLKDNTDIRIDGHNYGYKILNLGYKTKVGRHNEFELSLNNVFNNTGRVFGSSVDFAERNIAFKYKYNF